MRDERRHQADQGFTLVEVLVTLIVGAIFIATILQLYMLQSQISAQTSSYTNADLLAYNNLRTYAYGEPPTWFQCKNGGGASNPMPAFTPTGSTSGIPSPVTQRVIASAPYGCGGDSVRIGYPILIVSTVTFGPNNTKVVHATYATY